MAATVLTKLGRRLSRAVRRIGRRWTAPPTIDLGVLEPVRESVADSAASPTAVRRPDWLDSRLCCAADLASDRFRYWAEQIHEPFRLHRKLWEFCYICQALDERGLLRPGSRGLGFAVGQEPLPALFASRGCRITATDLPRDDSRVKHWESSLQWSSGLAELNRRGLCPDDEFRRLVEFRGADMNHIPSDLTGYDFTWSSCSFEHCGDLELGAQFLENQMRCLKPGGVAVHTTEFNLTSNQTTLDQGVTVIFRRRDLEAMARRLRAAGHDVEPLNFTLGDHPVDRHVDLPPYSPDRHLRLALGDWATTSIGLVIRRG